MDGFESFEGIEPVLATHHVSVLERHEEPSLEVKYGHFAQDSWVDYEIGLKKMDAIKTDLQEGTTLEKLRVLLASWLSILAISKDELTQANVEPFRIELQDPTPSFEKALRYNPTLTKFIVEEIQ